MGDTIKLSDSWKQILVNEFQKPYMVELKLFLASEKKQGKLIFPPGSQYFRALDMTPFDQVKVVILGQDPYHGPRQAHGLSFSVPKGVPVPPSLKNIFSEIQADLGMKRPDHGCLEAWAKQGVLLLNSVLTVECSRPASHQNRGWETFTDVIVQELNQRKEGLVFMLWGAYAQRKGKMIDRNRHLVLNSPHPSPLSAHRGFLGCRHFSAANQYLKKSHRDIIDWGLPA